jgi:2-methyl-3-hydroxypyridine 5-carboxylic acid dioxygenase
VTPARRHAEIAGAGFSGLAAATALCQRGWSVRVHEADAELRAFGAGIHIWNNGRLALQALDALSDVEDGAFWPPAYETRTNNEITSSEGLNTPGKDRFLSVTRQHLYLAMLAAARRAGAEIVTRSTAIGARADGTLLLQDGSKLKADVIIGADGVKSRVRDSFDLGMQRNRLVDGLIRVLAPRGDFRGGQWDHVIDFWHTRTRTLRMLYSPVNGDQVYLAMMSPYADKEASSIPINPAPWASCFPWFEPVVATLGARGRYDAYETTRLERWSEGKVAIVGDAAHAMPPTLGQGANTAICNALGLAVALDERNTVRDALELWERRERPLTDHTQRRAGEIAGARLLAGGMNWDDEGMRAARSIPTGTRELVMGR